ncbi:hypothetical protein OESDEN_15705 [Oesophagostomum dentatum]|uniref:Uncharacterized protein n=1 Tax=Oesophagostomum dentatum TaxID=61180 RepID=A0A0B1SI38_OESDE|nr:hypothetical protein OESDEN_15705 [Oesophagostomum dentatum]
MRILLFFTLLLGSVDSQCISVKCNSTASAVRCSDCSECRETGSR